MLIHNFLILVTFSKTVIGKKHFFQGNIENPELRFTGDTVKIKLKIKTSVKIYIVCFKVIKNKIAGLDLYRIEMYFDLSCTEISYFTILIHVAASSLLEIDSLQ